MKKLMLLVFFCSTYLVLNAQLQQIHDANNDILTTDSIYVLKSDTSYSTFKKPLQFTSFVEMRVHDLSKLIQRASEQKKSITLFLDGIEMKGIAPIGTDKSKEILFFILHRDSLSMKQWQIVRRIVLEKKKKELLVSIGLSGGTAYPSTLYMTAELSRSGDYYLAFLSYTFSVILFLFLVKRSRALRKNRQMLTDGYSLSKTLIALWAFIILFSILFLLAATNSMPHITHSVMIVLIISTITALLAKSVDAYKYVATGQNNDSSTTPFLKEIISDPTGISLFRLQLILITVLTGSYFIITVIAEMLLPEFDTYFLVLFGISHIIYLLFKLFERTEQL
jgi:hypothetical protein